MVRRLQPSFPATKPLDIIDIHPGVCLWSSKIHDALKPRRHILVEPNQPNYQSYIDPLLQRKDSKYRHVLNLSDLFSQRAATEYLPDQTPVGSKDIFKNTINPSLLILANFTNYGAKDPKYERSISQKYIREYLLGIMDPEQSFHHYGLVRMLAWLRNQDKNTIIPRAISDRHKFTVRLDVVAQVNEVAGGAYEISHRSAPRRQHELTLRSEQLVAQRAKDAGILTPENRKPPPSSPPWYEIGLGDGALDQLRQLPHRLPWQERFLEMYEEWGKGNKNTGENPFKAMKRKPERSSSGARRGKIVRSSVKGRPPSKEPREWRVLRTRFLTVRKQNIEAQDWANRQIELDKAEMKLLAGEQPASKYLASMKAIRRKADKLHAQINAGRIDLFRLVRKYIDDLRGFEQNPPLLQWDRRNAEPLLVSPNEFHPAQKLTLLDLQPVTDSLRKLSDLDQRTCFEFICHCLFRYPTQSMRDVLKTVVQGDIDDFLEKVPDLLDPSKGGNSNLDDLRARTLPVDLIVQLALALEKWPFRMQAYEMLVMIAGKREKNQMLVDDE